MWDLFENAINATTGNISSTTLDPGSSPHINATTSFTYDAQGDVATKVDPRSNAVSNSYDAMRRPTVVRHHNGGTSAALLAADRTNYNSLGQVTSTEGGTAFSGTSVTAWLTRESRTYTPTGQVATITNGEGDVIRTCYDDMDRAEIAVDGVGRARKTVYDLAGQNLETQAWWSASVSDPTCALTSTLPGGQSTRFLEQRSYTANGLVDWVDDANNNRSNYVYDGFDRLVRLEFPVTTIGQETPDTTNYEAYTYDANSNRLTLRLRSGDADTIGFGYDNLNRQTTKDIPGGTSADVTYAYDAAGRRASVLFTSSGQGIAYAYDTVGRLTSETSFSRALSYQYDAASNRTRITWPDANYAQYTYDALNRVNLIQESGSTTLADYDFDALGRRATLTRGDGTVTTYDYDDASRLTDLDHDLPGGTANDQALAFTYTDASQIASRTAANDNYAWIGANFSHDYERNGLNQYTEVDAAAFNYDGRGNLISDGTRNFDYDLENRLTQVTGGSLSFTAGYDPLGRLRQTDDGPTAVDFLYDGDALVAEYDGSTLLRRYVHGPGIDEPLVWYEGSGLTDRRYLIGDHQGSIIAANGAATERYTYGPYGEPNSWTGGRFRYTGQIILDPNLATANPIGLYHYKARAYCPECGRFLQTDAVYYQDDLNVYAYVANDPLNRTDPLGLQSRPSSCSTGSRLGSESSPCYFEGEGEQEGGDDSWAEAAETLTDIIIVVSNAAAEPAFAVERTLTGEGSSEDIATTTLMAVWPIVEIEVSVSAVSRLIWPGGRFATQARLADHFTRHGAGFGARSAAQYERMAARFLNGPRSRGTLEIVRANGDVVRFNPRTDQFGVRASDGTIRTYYKPDPARHRMSSNLDYFNAQR